MSDFQDIKLQNIKAFVHKTPEHHRTPVSTTTMSNLLPRFPQFFSGCLHIDSSVVTHGFRVSGVVYASAISTSQPWYLASLPC